MRLFPEMKSFKQEIKAKKSENCRENIMKNVNESNKKANEHMQSYFLIQDFV